MSPARYALGFSRIRHDIGRSSRALATRVWSSQSPDTRGTSPAPRHRSLAPATGAFDVRSPATQPIPGSLPRPRGGAVTTARASSAIRRPHSRARSAGRCPRRCRAPGRAGRGAAAAPPARIAGTTAERTPGVSTPRMMATGPPCSTRRAARSRRSRVSPSFGPNRYRKFRPGPRAKKNCSVPPSVSAARSPTKASHRTILPSAARAAVASRITSPGIGIGTPIAFTSMTRQAAARPYESRNTINASIDTEGRSDSVQAIVAGHAITQRGRMFWLWWKTLLGSYVVFTPTRRS